MKNLIYLILILNASISLVTPKLIELDEENWQEMLEGEWMVEFFAPWCPACKALQPIWRDFAGWSEDLGISVGHIDVTATPGLSGRFMVTALPTIFHIKDGIFRQYRGSRDKDEFINFIEEKKWENLEVVPAWKSPASFQMSVVSQFFKISMVLRGVHTSLVEDYGLPAWGSYILFGTATVALGAILGLMLVCVIDFLFPPKCPTPIPAPVVRSSSVEGKNSDEEDLIEDDDNKTEDDDNKTEDDDNKTEEDKGETEEEKNDEGSQAEEEDEDDEDENSGSEGNKEASNPNSPNVRKRRARKDD